MQMKERQDKIIELVSENHRMDVVTLANILQVSQVTVRKDLDVLVERRIIQREHGYAVINETGDLSTRIGHNYNRKKKIAALAASMVHDGETVMIESGTTCALLAEELATHKKNVTIITNSAFTASYIKEAPNAKIVLLGGDYQLKSQVVVGPVTRRCAADFSVEKIFVGADGYKEGVGFTGADLMRTDTMKAMAESAKRVLILTDSSKFSSRGLVTSFTLPAIHDVVTDEKIPAQIEQEMTHFGIQVHKVKL